MRNLSRRKLAALALCAVSLCAVFGAWRGYAQNRPVQQPGQAQRKWDYRYDTASKSFPTEADKARIAFYGVNGWELVAVVPGQNENALVFKRIAQAGN